MAVDSIFKHEEASDDVRIDATDLSKCFMNQASLLVHYARLSAQAQKQAATKKLMAETIYAKMDKKMREDAIASGKKTTENSVENEIKASSEYVKATMEMIEADAIETALRLIVEAFKERKDMLIQLGADARQEYEGSLRMSARAPTETYVSRHGSA